MNRYERHTTPSTAAAMPKPSKGNHYDRNQFDGITRAIKEVKISRSGTTSAAEKEAIRAAVARHNARNARRNAAAVQRTTTPAQRLQASYEILARKIGTYHHKNIAPLYRSERASVEYGEASAGVDYNAYSKSYGHAARWMNAGARIEAQDGQRVIVLQNYRGKDVATYPARELFRLYVTKRLSHAGTLDGDLYIVPTMKRKGHTIRGDRYRYDEKRGQFVKSGIAVEFDAPGSTRKYYEHGKNLKECKAEHARKVALYQQQQREKIARERASELERTQRAKIERAARLIARLCPKLEILFSDARAVGFCETGIKAYCDRRGLPTDRTDAATIRRAEAHNPPTNTSYTGERVIQHAARRAAVEMLTRRTA